MDGDGGEEPHYQPDNTSSPGNSSSLGSRKGQSDQDEGVGSMERASLPKDDSFRTIYVQGIPQGTSDEELSLFFESRRASKGGEIQTMKKVGQTATIIFEDQSVAERVLEQNHIKYKDGNLKLSKIPVASEDVVMEVRGFLSDATEEDLSDIFQLPKISQGAKILSLEFTPDHQAAHITYDNPTVAETLISKGKITIMGQPLKLSRVEIDAEETNAAIEICGFPLGTTADELQPFFENVKKSGGGEVMDVTILPGGNVARIEFRDPEVAKRVLNKGNLNMMGYPLTASPIKDKQESSVKVHYSNEDLTEDDLIFMFQHAKVSGGGEVKEVNILPNKTTAVITFKDLEEYVLSQQTIKFMGNTFIVSRIDDEEDNKDATVEVHGFWDGVTDEDIDQLFSNRNRTGGGPIANISLAMDGKVAEITFKDVETASSVLQRSPLKVLGSTLKVSRPGETSGNQPKPEHNTIIVTGLAKTATKDAVTFYFENSGRSGGGEVQDVKLHKETGTAHVTFCDPEVVGRVLQTENLMLERHPLKVRVFRERQLDSLEQEGASFPQDNEHDILSAMKQGSCTIIVKGVRECTAENSLRKYFETQSRSGGTNVREIMPSKENPGTYIITYDDEKVVGRVLSRPRHTLEGESLTVLRLEPFPVNDIEGPTELNKLLVFGITNTITKEDLLLHVSDIAKCDATDLMYSMDMTKAIVEFNEPPNIYHAIQQSRRYPLFSTMLGIQKVPETNSIQVTGIEDISEDQLCMYFESKKRSGGCETGLTLQIQRDYALVFFSDIKVLHRVLGQKRHEVSRQTLEVRLHYEDLGVFPPGWDPYNPVLIPQTTNLKLQNGHCVEYVKTLPTYREELDTKLAPLRACIEWPNSHTRGELKVRCLLSIKDEDISVAAREWETNTRQAIEEYMLSFSAGTFKCLPNLWTEVVPDTSQLLDRAGDLVVDINKTDHTITAIGPYDEVEDFLNTLRKTQDEADEELQRKKDTVSKIFLLKTYQILAVRNLDFCATIQRQHRHLEVLLDDDAEQITFVGLPSDIKDARSKMLEYFDGLYTKTIYADKLKLELLESPEAHAYLSEQLLKKNTRGVWKIHQDGILLVAPSMQEFKTAENCLQTEFQVITFHVPKESEEVLFSASWEQFVEEEQNKHHGLLKIVADDSVIQMVGLEHVIENTNEECCSFLEKTRKLTEPYQLELGPSSYITRHQSNQITITQAELKDHFVEIHYEDESNAFIISGTERGIQEAKSKIDALASQIQSEPFIIDEPGMPEYFRSRQGENDLHNVERNAKVIIELDSPQRAQQGNNNQGLLSSETLLHSTLDTGQQICLFQENPLEHKCDALVVPTNRMLVPLSPLLESHFPAPDKPGGRTLRPGKTNSMEVMGHPFKYLISVVDFENQSDTTVKRMVEECIIEADLQQCKTVAFPLFGTQAGYSEQVACSVMIQGILDVFREPDDLCVQEIHIVHENATNVHLLRTTMESILLPQAHRGNVTTQSQHPIATGATTTRTSGPVTKLEIGEITKIKAESIVNSTNIGFDLSTGSLSKSILAAAGPRLQQECKQKHPNGLQEGDVTCTSAHNITTCKCIIHAVCPTYDQGGQAIQLLQRVVEHILKEADKMKCSSVAIPALGSGNASFPKDLSANIIISQLMKLAKSQKYMHIKTVYIALHPKDVDNIKVYKNELKKTSKVSSIKTPPQAAVYPSGTTLPGNSTEMVTPINIQMKVEMGEIAKLRVDAVVNSTNTELDLSNGAISKSILAAAGPQIQDECLKNHPDGIKAGEVIVTASYNMACKRVIHVACPQWDAKGQAKNEFRKMVRRILEEATNKKVGSLAIPSLGTGNLGYPRDVVANTIVEEVLKYSKDQGTKTTLKMVRLIMHQSDPDSFKAFETAVESNSGKPLGGSRLNILTTTSPGPIVPVESDSVNDDPQIFGDIKSDNSQHQEVKIGSMKLQVLQGDITQSSAEALVNSTNETLNLRSGGVAKAILTAAGSDFQRECEQKANIMKKNGMCVTSAGKINSKVIIHLDAARNQTTDDWKRVIQDVLHKADELKMSSIAFPAIGTGMFSNNEQEMALAMMDAITSFAKRKTKHPKLVKIVIFQDTMFSTYCQAMTNTVEGSKSTWSAIKGWVKKKYDTTWGSSSVEETDDQVEKQQSLKTIPSSLAAESQPLNPCHPQMPGVCKSLTVNIYHVKITQSKDAIRQIRQICAQETDSKIISGDRYMELIRNLTPKQEDAIRRVENIVSARVHINRSQGKNSIEIWGSKETALVAQLEVLNIFDQLRDELRAKREAYELAQKISWEYELNGSFVKYDPQINAKIEEAQKNKKYMVEFYMDNEKCTVYITSKKHRDSKGSRSVRRVDLQESIDLPDTWEEMDLTQIVVLVDLPETHTEFKKVADLFLGTIGCSFDKMEKFQIERVQNPSLFKQYEVGRNTMGARNPPNIQNERHLWHGTSEAAVKGINTMGFNRSYTGKNATVYGEGAYFAIEASYSNRDTYTPRDSSGFKRMYYARVLTGMYTQGDSSMRHAPPKDPSKPHLLYDSVVDDESNPELFVVFNDSAAYPDYLITYKIKQ